MSSLNDLADQAGTMDTALAYIADELHTALLDLDRMTDPRSDQGPLALIDRTRGRLDRLADYVLDVQTRTAPANRPQPRAELADQMAQDLSMRMGAHWAAGMYE